MSLFHFFNTEKPFFFPVSTINFPHFFSAVVGRGMEYMFLFCSILSAIVVLLIQLFVLFFVFYFEKSEEDDKAFVVRS